jgi:hypothetical protein
MCTPLPAGCLACELTGRGAVFVMQDLTSLETNFLKENMTLDEAVGKMKVPPTLHLYTFTYLHIYTFIHIYTHPSL